MPRQITAFLEGRGVVHLVHKPALATEADINWADLILVMEEMHRDILADKFPQSMRKTKLLLEYCGGEGDLRDPMGKSDQVFEEVLKEIEEAIKKIVEK
jgi:protein-tyrosine phosphatase